MNKAGANNEAKIAGPTYFKILTTVSGNFTLDNKVTGSILGI